MIIRDKPLTRATLEAPGAVTAVASSTARLRTPPVGPATLATAVDPGAVRRAIRNATPGLPDDVPRAKRAAPPDWPVESIARFTTRENVVAMRRELPDLMATMIDAALPASLGKSPRDLILMYELGTEEQRGVAKVWSSAPRVVRDLVQQVLSHVGADGQIKLAWGSLDATARSEIVEQHVAYVSQTLCASLAMPREPARAILRTYFEVLARRPGAALSEESHAQLLSDLARFESHDGSVAEFFAKAANAPLLVAKAITEPSTILVNLASIYAGDAAVRLTQQLSPTLDQNSAVEASGMLRNSLDCSDRELDAMARDKRGLPSLIFHIAAFTNHMAFLAARAADLTALASGTAIADDAFAIATQRLHKSLVTPDRIMSEKPQLADHVVGQVQAYLISRGLWVPLEQSGFRGMPLREAVRTVAAEGAFAQDTRIPSLAAETLQQQFWDLSVRASRLSTWSARLSFASDNIAQMATSLAAHRAKATGLLPDRLLFSLRTSLGGMSSAFLELAARDELRPDSTAYKAAYVQLAPTFAFRALRETLAPEGAARVINDATFAHVVGYAARSVAWRGAVPDPSRVVDALRMAANGILLNDAFLAKPGFFEALAAECSPASLRKKVDEGALDLAIRLPHALWLFSQLTRGLVEGKDWRFTGAEADQAHDAFPAATQYTLPDLRDAEIYKWARHRLLPSGHSPEQANLVALGVVALTQFKDLLQSRKAAGHGQRDFIDV